MKTKLKLSTTILLIFGLSNLQAQTAIPAAGGAANGGGGSASYTAGQIFYRTQTDTNGNSIIEGIQQAYEIYSAVLIINQPVFLFVA